MHVHRRNTGALKYKYTLRLLANRTGHERSRLTPHALHRAVHMVRGQARITRRTATNPGPPCSHTPATTTTTTPLAGTTCVRAQTVDVM
jgi:hypothetical protein